MNQLKNRITEIRESRGLNMSELARRMGITPSQVQKLERGERGLDMKWIGKLSEALNISPELLIIAPPSIAILGLTDNHQYFPLEETENTRAIHGETYALLDEEEAPEILAARVSGDHNNPWINENDIIYFYHPMQIGDGQIKTSSIGKVCLIIHQDHSASTHILELGSNIGTYNLSTANGNISHSEIQLLHATPIIGIRKYNC